MIVHVVIYNKYFTSKPCFQQNMTLYITTWTIIASSKYSLEDGPKRSLSELDSDKDTYKGQMNYYRYARRRATLPE